MRKVYNKNEVPRIFNLIQMVRGGLVVLFMMLLSFNTYAQERTISGVITSGEDDEPLPGVTVLVKGTTNGTITDIDGNYQIAVNEDAVLAISFVGFKSQEVVVGDRSNIDVSLELDVTSLDEVVVVGYGEMRRIDMTGAQTSVTAKDIERTVNTTIEQAIQGRAAGVYVTQNTGQPGGGISVNIRGVNSISGSNEPLYVIDGVQIQPSTVSYGATSSNNALAGINPADIESLEVLQGPSATAIYGSRAANGVILITTKRGKSGAVKVSYGYLHSIQTKPEQLDVMNLREYAQMVLDYHALAGGTPPEEFLDPSLLGEGTDWQNELFKTAPLIKHQLSLSGGNDKTTYYLSGEFFDQEGVAQGSSFDRYSIRLNLDNQPREWIKLGANLNFSETSENLSSTQENVINNALRVAPHVPVKNIDGTWGGADDTNGASVQFTPLNPVAISRLVSNEVTRRQFLGGLNASIDLWKGLTFRTSFNGNIGSSISDFFTPTYRLGNKTNDVASLTTSSSTSTYWNWNQLLEYNLQLGKHDIRLMASHEAQASSYQSLSGTRRGFVTNDVPDLNIGDSQGMTNSGGRGDWAMESYLGRVNYSFADRYIVQGTIRADGSVNFGPENRWGVFPSVSAAWRLSEESFFNIPVINEFKIRVETGVTGNQGGSAGIFSPLAAVSTPWGAGFRARRYGNPGLQWEETVTNNIGFNLNLFKNRIQLEGDFYVKNTDNLILDNPLPWYMGTSGEGSIEPPVVNIGALENKGWGITLQTVNIQRTDFSWKSNFNISGFKTKVTEFYSESAFIDRVAWYMDNWTQRSTVGEAPWLFYGYVEEGLFQSLEDIESSALPVDNNGDELAVGPNGVYVGDVKYKDINGDGVITQDDQTYIGNPWPKLFAGFTNSFSYKEFELSILLTSTYGNDIYNYLRYSNTNPNNINLGRNLLQETYDYARIGADGSGNPVIENGGTHIPRISNGPNGNFNRFTDKYVEDGSFIRVKNINLSYSLPSSLLSRQNVIRGAHVSIGAQNLYTLTKYKGYDPEVGAYVGRDVTAESQSQGLDFGRYPLTPVYTFSVGVDF